MSCTPNAGHEGSGEDEDESDSDPHVWNRLALGEDAAVAPGEVVVVVHLSRSLSMASAIL